MQIAYIEIYKEVFLLRLFTSALNKLSFLCLRSGSTTGLKFDKSIVDSFI